ncbi:hypothetical protein [Cupriavidus sp. D39]|uniref:hypothetical protein n=1 Tax=Cupriavidus sp. D39 TaxID=2997877 RepID=UPI00226DE840|nr:hypothetical protein [Cupriavidus sp. D39]MCY0858719.1 hypothetical protein [Cupriavidus sp. D39]
MDRDRPTRECTEIILTALRQNKALGRRGMLAKGLLTDKELDRALKSLRAAGAIRRCTVSANAPARDVRYEATEVPLSPPRAARSPARPRAMCFDNLLAAWRIQMPRKSTWSGGPAGIINNAFALEELHELAALRSVPQRSTTQTIRQSVNA